MKIITLPQLVKCEEKPLAFAKVNCTHWNLDPKGECKAYCNLKKQNADYQMCLACEVREPLENIDEKNKSMAQQMRERLPQQNYYTKEKLQGKDIEIDPTKKTFLEKTKQYAMTESSQFIEGKVSEEVFEKRKVLCMECPRRKNPTPESEPIGWCATCGCSAKNPRAALSNKLWMPNLVCPLNKFPQEKGEGFNVGDAVNSVKGAMQSVASLFKSDGNT